MLPKLELSAGVSLVSIEDESDTSLGGGFAYSLTDKVALGASLLVADDAIGAGIGMRFYFPVTTRHQTHSQLWIRGVV